VHGGTVTQAAARFQPRFRRVVRCKLGSRQRGAAADDDPGASPQHSCCADCAAAVGSSAGMESSLPPAVHQAAWPMGWPLLPALAAAPIPDGAAGGPTSTCSSSGIPPAAFSPPMGLGLQSMLGMHALAMISAMNGNMNGPMNGTMNGPMNGPMNAEFGDALQAQISALQAQIAMAEMPASAIGLGPAIMGAHSRNASEHLLSDLALAARGAPCGGALPSYQPLVSDGGLDELIDSLFSSPDRSPIAEELGQQSTVPAPGRPDDGLHPAPPATPQRPELLDGV